TRGSLLSALSLLFLLLPCFSFFSFLRYCLSVPPFSLFVPAAVFSALCHHCCCHGEWCSSVPHACMTLCNTYRDTCTHTHTHTHTHRHTHTHTHICRYTFTHTHTHLKHRKKEHS